MDDKKELPLQMKKMLLPSQNNTELRRMTVFRLMYGKSCLYATIWPSFLTVPPAKVEGCDFAPRDKGEKRE